MSFRVPLRTRRGFTMVEVIVTIAVMSVLLGALFGLVIRSQQSYAQQRIGTQAEETVRTTELLLARMFRSGGADPLGRRFPGIDPNPLNHAVFDNVRLRGDFNPADGDTGDPLEDILVHQRADTVYVRWDSGGASEPLAYPVQSLRFEYYAANGARITNPALIGSATRVRFSVAAPRSLRSNSTLRRDTWIFLRN